MTELPFGEPFKEAWQEWIEWRKEMRFKKYVERGLKKTLSALVKMSGNDEQIAIEIIDQSIANNWQGLFPLKINNGNTINKTGNATHKGTSESRINALQKWGI